eukprot:UN00985
MNKFILFFAFIFMALVAFTNATDDDFTVSTLLVKRPVQYRIATVENNNDAVIQDTIFNAQQIGTRQFATQSVRDDDKKSRNSIIIVTVLIPAWAALTILVLCLRHRKVMCFKTLRPLAVTEQQKADIALQHNPLEAKPSRNILGARQLEQDVELQPVA